MARLQQQAEQQDRTEQECDLGGAAPGAAVGFDVVPRRRHDEQVNSGAEQCVAYVRAGVAALGGVPTDRCVVAERFFDEAGGMQLIVPAPFGARINRAWGLALRPLLASPWVIPWVKPPATSDPSHHLPDW